MARLSSGGLLCWVLMLATGCTISHEAVGAKLSRDRLERLETLRTKAEVLETLGPPDDVALQLTESLFLYRFRYEDAEALNLSMFRVSVDYDEVDRRTDRLLVFFDKQGQVTRYGFDLSAED